jgi:hypothetical protein
MLYKDSSYYFNIKICIATVIAFKREIKVYLKRFIETFNNKKNF